MQKEKTDKQFAIMVQPSLHKCFEEKCIEEHRSVSEVVRELMSKYAKGWIQLPEREKAENEN